MFPALGASQIGNRGLESTRASGICSPVGGALELGDLGLKVFPRHSTPGDRGLRCLEASADGEPSAGDERQGHERGVRGHGCLRASWDPTLSQLCRGQWSG